MLQSILVAISFLTLFPVKTGEVSPSTLTGSGAYFPLAGWIIGLIMAGGGWLLFSAGLSPMACAVLLVACEAWLTRGLHLDGVADIFDGMGGSFDTKKRLAIMKDSATGAFGVVGLVLTLLLKTAGLTVLIGNFQTDTVVFSLFFLAFVPAASRWAMTSLAWKSRYPRESGTGHVFVGQVQAQHLFIGFITLLPVLLPASRVSAGFIVVLSAFVLCLLPSLLLRYKAHKLFGGVTGDVLGASCEFGEALGWLAFSLFLSS